MKFFGLELRKAPKVTVKNDTSTVPNSKYDYGNIFVFSPYMSVGEMLANTTLASCVYIIADAVASLSFVVYRNKDDSRERATDMPLYRLFARRPNENDTPFIFKKKILLHLLLKGNAFIFVERDRNFQPTALYTLDPSSVEIKKTSEGEVYYLYHADGKTYKYNRDTILHIPAIRYDRLRGFSPIEYATHSAKTGLELDEYTYNYFDGGIHSKIMLTVPKEVTTWTKEDSDQLIARFLETYGGKENANKPLILNKGLTGQPLNLSGNGESQLVELRAFSEKEIAKIYRVPLFMLGKDSAKFTNMEQMNTFFLQQTLTPWLVLLNQYFSTLIPSWMQDDYYAEFDPNTILRADANTRFNNYIKGFNNGIYTLNEIRKMENLPKIDEDFGDKHFLQLNMSPISDIESMEDKENGKNPDSDNQNKDNNNEGKNDNSESENEDSE